MPIKQNTGSEVPGPSGCGVHWRSWEGILQVALKGCGNICNLTERSSRVKSGQPPYLQPQSLYPKSQLLSKRRVKILTSCKYLHQMKKTLFSSSQNFLRQFLKLYPKTDSCQNMLISYHPTFHPMWKK